MNKGGLAPKHLEEGLRGEEAPCVVLKGRSLKEQVKEMKHTTSEGTIEVGVGKFGKLEKDKQRIA